jgi:ribosomal protein S12 methylthiotransferase accessory factor
MLDVAESSHKVRGSYDRCVPLERSLELIPELRARYGITRVGDITKLDRIGIPTFCAIVPTSLAGLSVYNGKGATKEAALASAVFEAVERQAAASPSLPVRSEKAALVREFIDLDRLGLSASAREADLECVLGRDLLNERSVPVPLAIVQLRRCEARTFPRVTSNGLAAGNTLTEAIYHALCELIERHVWSLYCVRCEVLPRMLQGSSAPDYALAAELRIPTGEPAVDSLATRVVAADLRLRVMYLWEDDLPPVMIASIVDPHSQPPMCHIGLGCSLSPAHAAIRAITEAAQSRLTDIQGAREDALRPNETSATAAPVHTRRTERVPTDSWLYDLPARTVQLSAIRDRSTDSLLADMRCILSDLASLEASCVIIVDLTPPHVPARVVRAIVPQLETTCLDGRIGPKGREALNPFGAFPKAT